MSWQGPANITAACRPSGMPEGIAASAHHGPFPLILMALLTTFSAHRTRYSRCQYCCGQPCRPCTVVSWHSGMIAWSPLATCPAAPFPAWIALIAPRLLLHSVQDAALLDGSGRAFVLDEWKREAGNPNAGFGITAVLEGGQLLASAPKCLLNFMCPFNVSIPSFLSIHAWLRQTPDSLSWSSLTSRAGEGSGQCIGDPGRLVANPCAGDLGQGVTADAWCCSSGAGCYC